MPALADAWTIMQINLRSSSASSKMYGIKFKPRGKKGLVVEIRWKSTLWEYSYEENTSPYFDTVRAALECAAPRSVRQDSRIGRYFVSINRRMGTWSNRPSLVGSSGCGRIYLILHHEPQYLGRCVLFVEYSTGRNFTRRFKTPTQMDYLHDFRVLIKSSTFT